MPEGSVARLLSAPDRVERAPEAEEVEATVQPVAGAAVAVLSAVMEARAQEERRTVTC
jgi:hypothetical protein